MLTKIEIVENNSKGLDEKRFFDFIWVFLMNDLPVQAG